MTSRRPESREAFAEQLRAQTDTPVRVTSSFEETFDGADILVEATRLTTPSRCCTRGWSGRGRLS